MDRHPVSPTSNGVGGPRTAPPLVALLGASARGFAAQVTERLQHTPYPELTLAHSTIVLRWLHDGPKTSTEIVKRSGVTKQAVSQHVGYLVQIGLVEMVEHPDDRRARLVKLTRRGRGAQRTVHRLFTEIESDWRAQIDGRDWDVVLAALTKFASLGSDSLPPV